MSLSHVRCFVGSAFILALVTWSEQATAVETEIRLGARGVAEAWQDSALTSVYRSSRFGGAGMAGLWIDLGLPVDLGIEGDFAYHRMDGAAQSLSTGASGPKTTFELIPAAFRASVRYPLRSAELYLGIGTAITGYQEAAPVGSVSGNKVGLSFETGVRFDTHIVDTPLQTPSRALQKVDAEIFFGRREHHLFGVGQGLDLSSWRAGVGLVAGF